MVTTQAAALLVPFLLTASLLNGAEAGGPETTCTATTSLTSSSVTCHFHKDVSKHKENFIVQFYYPSITSNPENLIYCYWTDTMHCTNTFWVSFNEPVTDQVTVTSPSKVDRQSGLYRCQLVPSNHVPSHVCNVTFVGDAQTTSIAAEEGDKHDDTSATDILAVVSFVGVVLIVTTVLVCLLYKYRERVYKFIGRRADTNQRPDKLGGSSTPFMTKNPSAGNTDTGGDTLASRVATRVDTDLQLLIIGPQGSGKSSLANTITGEDSFPVGHSIAGVATTRRPVEAVVTLCGKTVKVVDTPYICDPNRYSEEDQRQQVSQWRKMTSPGPSAILLALSGKDVFFIQHYEDYQQLKTLWGDEDFCRRLIVVFTFADKRRVLYPGISIEKQLETAVPNLKRILYDAGNYYLEISNLASQGENGAVVKEILDGAERKAKSISAAVGDNSVRNLEAVSSAYTQANVLKKEPMLQTDPSYTSSQQQPPAHNVGAAGPVTPLSMTQSGQNTDTAQPPQEHSQETVAVETSTAPPGSPELQPLVQRAEDGSGDKDEKQEDKPKKKKDKKAKKEGKAKFYRYRPGKY